MPSSRSRTISAILGKLRKAIFTCAVAVCIGLSVQVFVWSMVTFTDLRWEEPESTEVVPLIVQSDMITSHNETSQDPAQAIRSAAGTEINEKPGPSESPRETGEKPELVLSSMDGSFAYTYRCARGIGTAGMIAMLPLLMMAVLIAASSATRGSEKSVSAFILCIVVAILVLPFGEVLSLPWDGGALSSYEHMAGQVDQYLNEPSKALGPLVFYARYLLLSITSLIGTALVFLRLSSSVEMAIIAGDELHVDPNIEAEASNVQVNAGKGSRAAQAISSMVVPTTTPQEDKLPPAGQVSPSEAPKRLI